MASIAAKAKREFIARERLQTVIASLSASLGVERIAEGGRPVRDKELRQVMDLEEIADFLERVAEKMGGNVAAEEIANENTRTMGDESDADKIAAYLTARESDGAEDTENKPKTTARRRR